MPVPPEIAWRIAERVLPAAERQRLADLVFRDEGHGYDAFGLHPAHVALGLALTAPLYDAWFRVISRGIEHVPSSGAAILAANHAGTLPLDAMMIWTDVLRRTTPPRVLRPVADHFVPNLPWIGTFFTRGGMVGGSRGNARALLEAGNLLLVFPEGTPAIGKPFSERYHLLEWRVGHVELAIRHGVPVVPVAVVGSEEQMPQVGRIPFLRPFGAPYLPIPLTPVPLPVRYHIHYGAPVRFDSRPDQADDPGVLSEAASRVRSAVEDLLQAGLRMRQGLFA
ncbi:MAG: 1-acyl-sn-glycerol-3-phosphate acyltransferase [Deltaproteobacteria bacterium]|nr:1-acyl-sn-glycerol-3-phosphate acyltransferase [Deltaproteobacteria bacterium]